MTTFLNYIFTKGSHHRDTSVMFIVHSLFGKKQRTTYHQLGQSLSGGIQEPKRCLTDHPFSKQMYPAKLRYVPESYKEATSIPHGYLMIDLQQDTPDHLRLRTTVFPPEHPVCICKSKNHVYPPQEKPPPLKSLVWN